jgi:hypothetical protein
MDNIIGQNQNTNWMDLDGWNAKGHESETNHHDSNMILAAWFLRSMGLGGSSAVHTHGEALSPILHVCSIWLWCVVADEIPVDGAWIIYRQRCSRDKA